MRYSVSVINFRKVKLEVVGYSLDFLTVSIENAAVGTISTDSLSTAQVITRSHIKAVNNNLPVIVAKHKAVELVGVVFHDANIAKNPPEVKRGTELGGAVSPTKGSVAFSFNRPDKKLCELFLCLPVVGHQVTIQLATDRIQRFPFGLVHVASSKYIVRAKHIAFSLCPLYEFIAKIQGLFRGE